MMKFFRNLTTRLVWGVSGTGKPEGTGPGDLLQAAMQSQYNEQYEDALDWLAKAEDLIQKQPANSVTAMNLQLNRADLYIYQQRYEEAEALLNTVMEDAKARKHQTPRAYALCALGTIQQARDDWQLAREKYEAALDIVQTVKAEGAQGRATGHLADVYMHDDNQSYAIHLYRQAIPLLQNSGDTMLLPYFMLQLGRALLATQQYIDGEMILLRGLERARAMRHRLFSRELSLEIASRAYEKGDYDAARRHYENAVQLMTAPLQATPQTIEALLNLNDVARRTGQDELSLKAMERAESLFDEIENTVDKARIHLALGENFQQNRAFDDAKTHFEAGLTLYDTLPEDAMTVTLLRHLSLLETDFDTALTHLKRAEKLVVQLALDTEIAAIQVTYAEVYVQADHITEAIDHWQQALNHYEASHDHDYIALYTTRIASAYLWLGQGKQAKRHLEKALIHTGSMENQAYKFEVLRRSAEMYTAAGQMETAENFYQDMLTLAKTRENQREQAIAQVYYGRFLVLIQDSQPALLALHEAQRLCKSQSMLLEEQIAVDAMATAYRHNKNLPEALHHHEQVIDRIDEILSTVWQLNFRLNYAQSLFTAERLAEIPVLLNEIEAQSRAIHHAPLVVEVLLLRAALALAHKEPDAVKPHLDAIEALMGHLQQPRMDMAYYHHLANYHQQTDDTAAASAAQEKANKLQKLLYIRTPAPQK